MAKKPTNYIWTSYFGIANVWLWWFFPLFLLLVLIPTAYGHESLGGILGIFALIGLMVLDIKIRIKRSHFKTFDALTLPKEGYIFHLFIFPIPLWMACIVAIIVFYQLVFHSL